MDGKRSAQEPSDVAPDSQPSAKRQTREDAEVSGSGSSAAAPAAVSAPEETPVTISFTMRGDPSGFITQPRKAALEASALRKAALVAALRKVVTEWGVCDMTVVRTHASGPSEDTLQRVLPLVLKRVGLEERAQCFWVCKSWRRELEAWGVCSKTLQLCSTLAEGAEDSDRVAELLGQHAQQRLDASTGEPERSMCLDTIAFLQRSRGWEGSLPAWLQAASQEPDANFLSRGAASTAKVLGVPLVRWVGKPQGRVPGSYTPAGHSGDVISLSFSWDGKWVATGSEDSLMKIWDVATGAEVSIFE